MIDIHAHLLPEVDDGAPDMKSSLIMAKAAVENGVHTMIVTPHSNRKDFFKNYLNENLEKRFVDLQKAVEREQIPLRILPGMEIYGTKIVPDLLRKGKLISLNRSRYILLEFGREDNAKLMNYIINELVYMGYYPIIAHPEKYPYVQNDPDIVYGWIAKGCFLQVNKDSFLGNFGKRTKKTAFQLLNGNLVSIVASDAHGIEHRTTDLSKVYQLLSDIYTDYYANILLEENPRRVVENLDLIPVLPLVSLRYQSASS